MKPMTMTKLADLLKVFFANHLQAEVVSTSTEGVTFSATVKSTPKEFVEFTSKLVQLCSETTPEIQSNGQEVYYKYGGGDIEYFQNDRPATAKDLERLIKIFQSRDYPR